LRQHQSQLAGICERAEFKLAIFEQAITLGLLANLLFNLLALTIGRNRRVNDGQQHVALEWLDQIVIGASSQPLAHRIRRPHRSLHDDGHAQITRVFLDEIEHGHAVHARHHAIKQHRIKTSLIAFDDLPGRFAIFGHDNVVTGIAQMLAQDFQIEGFIVDQ